MTLPRSVQAGLYQHTQSIREPDTQSTPTANTPRSRRRRSEHLSHPHPGQHTRPPLFGRQRGSWTPSWGARGPTAAPAAAAVSTLGESQPARDDQPNVTTTQPSTWL